MGVSIEIFNHVTKVFKFPLVSVTTSLLAEEDATTKIMDQELDMEGSTKDILDSDEIDLLIYSTYMYFKSLSIHVTSQLYHSNLVDFFFIVYISLLAWSQNLDSWVYLVIQRHFNCIPSFLSLLDSIKSNGITLKANTILV